VYLTHLTLRNFRNYRRADLALARGITVFYGGNAQGKTNLLEALYLLATTRPARGSDADLIRHDAAADDLPAAYVAGRVETRRGSLFIEAAIAPRDPIATAPLEHVAKRLKINGVPRRAADVIGQFTAVLFTATDLDLITGAPALRRRYLDITIAQTNTSYLRTLQRYNRALLQRNSLLRRIDEGRAHAEELDVWDDEIAREGGRIVRARGETVRALARAAHEHARRLSGGHEALTVAYAPQLALAGEELPAPEQIAAALREQLRAARRREIALGQTLVGPHRDDLRFTLDGMALALFGSRAQLRTAALALRLAEADYLATTNADPPVLLLDDIFSELDAERRHAVLTLLPEAEQVFVTTTDRALAAEGTRLYEVREGCIGAPC